VSLRREYGSWKRDMAEPNIELLNFEPTKIEILKISFFQVFTNPQTIEVLLRDT
jgi:hypothetical protein